LGRGTRVANVDSPVNGTGSVSPIAVSNVGNGVSRHGNCGGRNLLVVPDDYSVVEALHMHIGDSVAVRIEIDGGKRKTC